MYVPQSLKANPGLLAAVHPCGGTAQVFYSGTDFKPLADQYGFAVVYPDAPDATNCFDVHTDATLKHDAGGDSLGIANGVRYLIDQLDVDPEKVFATGYSSGGMMTNVLAGAYPDIFKAGASFAGVAYACMAGPGFFNSECDSGRRVKTAEEWGNLVRGAYPGYTGPRPKMQIWHGSQDEVVNPQNYYEALKQWRNVFNASETPTATQQNWPISGWTKTEYGPDVQGIFASGVTHFIPVQATQVVQWMGLDK